MNDFEWWLFEQQMKKDAKRADNNEMSDEELEKFKNNLDELNKALDEYLEVLGVNLDL